MNVIGYINPFVNAATDIVNSTSGYLPKGGNDSCPFAGS